MNLMKSLSNDDNKAEVVRRLRTLRPDSPRRWGRMSAHQMVCHLSDSFRTTMGLKVASPSGNVLHRTVVKWVALHSPLPWPKGVATRPEVDQEFSGTRPIEFKKDMDELLALISRFTAMKRDFEWQQHPVFGTLTETELLRWGYLHADHHLRQFGA